MLDILHYILIAVGIIQLIIIFLIVKYETFKAKVKELITLAEEKLKGEEGKEKLAYVLNALKESSLIAKWLATTKLVDTINRLVAEYNRFCK